MSKAGIPPPTDNSQGLLFGSDPSCDVVLPTTHGVSPVHGAFSFDLGSLYGSQVTYDGVYEGCYHKNFCWILGGADILEGVHVVLSLTDSLSCVVLCTQTLQSPAYADNVCSFGYGHWDVTGTPEPIHLLHLLGEGAFSQVFRQWNVSTGADIAIKRPSPKALQTDTADNRWKKEYDIMRRLSHPNIVAVLGADFSVPGQSCLMLEYASLGSLRGQCDDVAALTLGECLQVMEQCLSALAYLHDQSPHPLVHRDIKPDNILVRSRQHGRIHVQLADFGLTKDSPDLTSVCGTRPYFAPEIHDADWRRAAARRLHGRRRHLGSGRRLWRARLRSATMRLARGQRAGVVPCGDAAFSRVC